MHDTCFQSTNDSVEQNADVDSVRQMKGSFMRWALLLRDTENAYAMCDGDRVFRNAKFEILLCDAQNHYKYRIWLFRLLAYEKSILTPREAFEYKWNIAVNTKGGIGKNIPNDNLVELKVRALKERLRGQGANVSFQTACVALHTMQINDETKNNLAREAGYSLRSGEHKVASKEKDIKIMVGEIMAAKGAYYPNFKFKDPLSKVKVDELHQWMTKQKELCIQKLVF